VPETLQRPDYMKIAENNSSSWDLSLHVYRTKPLSITHIRTAMWLFLDLFLYLLFLMNLKKII